MENPTPNRTPGRNEPGRQDEGDVGSDPRRTREQENDRDNQRQNPSRNPGQTTPKTG